MNQNVKTIIPSIIGGLINWAIILPIGSIFLGFYLSVSLEAKLAMFNGALILLVIILLFRHHFSPHRVRVMKSDRTPHTYLIKDKVARHIPDMETFEYLGQLYGFHQRDIEEIPYNDFTKQFSTESTLPSILPHFQKIYEQKIK
jgi:hypothetical protein